MVDTVEVKALVTDTKHDGTNMIVLTEGKNVTIAASSVEYLFQRGLIEDPYGDLTTGRVGGVNIATKADGFQLTSKSAGDLAQMSLSELFQVVLDEGVLDDLKGFREHLIRSIEEKRVAGDDEAPVGDESEVVFSGDVTGTLSAPVGFEGTADIDHDDLVTLTDADGNPADVPEGDLEAELAAGGQPLDITDEERAELPQLDHDGNGEPGGSLPADPPALSGMNKAMLIAQAEVEGVDVTDEMTKAEIVAAVEAGRAAAGDDEAPVE